MPDMLTEVMRKAGHEMVVCNACRYCEAYCPVFQAMEQRVTFQPADLTYLANLCHNCGECLYACQYAPPHEFNIDVPRTLSGVRVESYESFAWPSFAAVAFRRPWVATLVAIATGALICAPIARTFSRAARTFQVREADFYRVIPHDVMVMLFGVVSLFVVAAIAIGHRRFATIADLKGPRRSKDVTSPPRQDTSPRRSATIDVLTLKHLHATGEDCVDAEEQRRPWRRWLHHCTFYGFALCFASTTVAAIYHAFGWIAPYAYTSAPVVLGTVGGLGLVIGPAGLLMLDRRRDPALTHASERALGLAFLTMLLLTSVTGLLLLALRERPYMPTLLVLHLSIVLALFITFPYGKFVHGIYRGAALLKFRREESV
ncbi:MAG TPA: tricarballylate utilization 4Fe-4S protein TcuB [Vicinamibacterales bacterium]|nr:tricarballylate utilization 4Fe-4S protein TcuB [Vicinamibacterales bacterium]